MVWQIPGADRKPTGLSESRSEQITSVVGCSGTPESFVRAGTLGLPLMVAIIGGETHRFRALVDLYREAGAKAGFTPEHLKVGRKNTLPL